MEVKEVKELFDGLAKDWEEFKKTNDEKLEAKADGKGVAEFEGKLSKLNDAIDEKQGKLDEQSKRIDELEAALKRKPLSKKGHDGNELSDEEVKHGQAVVDYLRKGEKADAEHIKMLDERKDLQVRVDPDGGYRVHADMGGRLVKLVYETSPIRQYANVMNISTDALEGIVDDDDAGYEWVGETTTPTDETTPQIREYRIPVHELATIPKATNKILEDADVDVEGWLLEKVRDKFARVTNAAFVTGDGAGKPRGFLTYAASADPDVYTYGAIGQFETAASATLDADAMIDLTTGLKEHFMANAVVAANRFSWREARKLKDSEGQYLWERSLQAGQPATFNGVPVAVFSDIPNIAAGSLSFAIADWNAAYQIVDRIGFSVLRDPYTSKPYVKFYCRHRVGGDVIDFDAIKILKIKA